MHRPERVAIAGIAILVAIAGCSSTGSPAGSTTVAPTQAAASAAGTPASTSGSAAAGDLGEPVQLSLDPCTLITQDEAEATLGVAVSPLKTDANGGGGITVCNYVGVGSPAHLLASTPSAADCKLLYLQIERRLYGGAQEPVDDIGDGGMIVTGEGNLQIAVSHGCIELDGATADAPLPDATMLDLARTAVGRVP